MCHINEYSIFRGFNIASAKLASHNSLQFHGCEVIVLKCISIICIKIYYWNKYSVDITFKDVKFKDRKCSKKN